jgi:hypothetical protein
MPLTEEAREGLEEETAEDDEAEDHEPEHGNGRLLNLLDLLLDLVLRLAHAGLVLLGELCVRLTLLNSLRHGGCGDVVAFRRCLLFLLLLGKALGSNCGLVGWRLFMVGGTGGVLVRVQFERMGREGGRRGAGRDGDVSPKGNVSRVANGQISTLAGRGLFGKLPNGGLALGGIRGDPFFFRPR